MYQNDPKFLYHLCYRFSDMKYLPVLAYTQRQYRFLHIRHTSVTVNTDYIKVWNLISVATHPGGILMENFYNPVLVGKDSKAEAEAKSIGIAFI